MIQFFIKALMAVTAIWAVLGMILLGYFVVAVYSNIVF